ncbi:unnamed protein product, partial [Prorocentrum cordatum]
MGLVETHLYGKQLGDEQRHLRGMGWRTEYTTAPATPTSGKGSSGGALWAQARQFNTFPHLATGCGDDLLCQQLHDIAITMVRLKHVTVAFITIYLTSDPKGLDLPTNISKLNQLLTLVRTLGTPWMVYGDFNNTPEQFRASCWHEAFAPEYLQPNCEFTCAGSSGRMIDWGLCSPTFLPLVKSVEPVYNVPWQPRVGTEIRMHSSSTILKMARYWNMAAMCMTTCYKTTRDLAESCGRWAMAAEAALLNLTDAMPISDERRRGQPLRYRLEQMIRQPDPMYIQAGTKQLETNAWISLTSQLQVFVKQCERRQSQSEANIGTIRPKTDDQRDHQAADAVLDDPIARMVARTPSYQCYPWTDIPFGGRLQLPGQAVSSAPTCTTPWPAVTSMDDEEADPFDAINNDIDCFDYLELLQREPEEP